MTTIVVTAAVIDRDGRLLVTRRPPGVHLEGYWEFPGGKREPEETFEECLARELREELGIEVTVGGLLESLDHEYPDRIVHLRFFRCVWRQHEPQALGCAAFKWVTAAELNGYAFPAADARLLETLKQDEALWAER